MKSNQIRILIAGGTGLVGSRLQNQITREEGKVTIMTRNKKLVEQDDHIYWDPEKGIVEDADFSDVQAIINLAGAGVMSHAWTDEYKKLILKSRTDATRCIGELIAKMEQAPVLISSSAIGYYGYASENVVFHENDRPHEGDYLQTVTIAWEKSAALAAKKAARHVILRIGIVLASEGGALAEMRKGCNAGFGSYFNPGNQIYSWIHIDDLCRMIRRMMVDEQYSGVYNAVSPDPVTARDLTAKICTIAHGHHRVLPVPIWTARMILGARHTLLTGSCRVSSQKIEKAGFSFNYPILDQALSELL